MYCVVCYHMIAALYVRSLCCFFTNLYIVIDDSWWTMSCLYYSTIFSFALNLVVHQTMYHNSMYDWKHIYVRLMDWTHLTMTMHSEGHKVSVGSIDTAPSIVSVLLLVWQIMCQFSYLCGKFCTASRKVQGSDDLFC